MTNPRTRKIAAEIAEGLQEELAHARGKTARAGGGSPRTHRVTEPIELHPYDPAWPAAFEAERTLIAPLFPSPPILIEHMGSTSIPGLAAKSVIDIIVLVRALDDAHRAVPALEATGYSFWRDNPDKTKLYLVKGLPPAPKRTHHLHIYDHEPEVRRHLIFGIICGPTQAHSRPTSP